MNDRHAIQLRRIHTMGNLGSGRVTARRLRRFYRVNVRFCVTEAQVNRDYNARSGAEVLSAAQWEQHAADCRAKARA